MKYQHLASELSGVPDRPDESTPFAHSLGVRLWVWSKNLKLPPPTPLLTHPQQTAPSHTSLQQKGSKLGQGGAD